MYLPVNVLEHMIDEIDMVLVMTVNPGFGGQKFIANTYDKVEQLKELILRKNSRALIQVDGGVDNTNAKRLVSKGADVLVAGSYVFKSANPEQTIHGLKSLDF